MKQVASIAVIGSRDSILFIRRSDNGKWTMPGGHLNEGEDPKEGALRELYEETGIRAPKDKLVAIGSGVVDGKYKVWSFQYKKPHVQVDLSKDPDEEADDYCWFDEDSDSDYASSIPTNVHVPNDKNVTLALLGRTTPSDALKLEPVEGLAKMAIKDLEPGEKTEDDYGNIVHDYGHLLPGAWKGKLTLHVHVPSHGEYMKASLLDKDNEEVGHVKGEINRMGPDSLTPHSELHEDYHGEGLGKAMYEALYAHAYHKMGKRNIVGGSHSHDAGRVHEALARKHGFNYIARTKNSRFGLDRASYMYNLDDTKKSESLTKGVLGAVAGAVMSMSPGLQNAFDAVNPPEHAQQVQTHVQQAPAKPKWTPDGLHPSLIPIAHLESSFGQNMNHAPNSKGDYHTAFGPVGFKVNTAHEEWMKSNKLKELYPGLEDPKTFTDKFKSDWKLYNLLASSHFLRLTHRHGTPEKAAYAWRYGSTAAQGADDDKIAKEPYVLRYRDLAATTGVKKAERNPMDWRSTDGITVPHHTDTARRKAWDKSFYQKLVENFGYGDAKRLKKIKVPVSQPTGGNMVVNKPRYNMYVKMAQGGDTLPPVVVRRNGLGYNLLDGNHRQAAAQKAGLTHMDAYELLDPPPRKL